MQNDDKFLQETQKYVDMALSLKSQGGRQVSLLPSTTGTGRLAEKMLIEGLNRMEVQSDRILYVCSGAIKKEMSADLGVPTAQVKELPVIKLSDYDAVIVGDMWIRERQRADEMLQAYDGLIVHAGYAPQIPTRSAVNSPGVLKP